MKLQAELKTARENEARLRNEISTRTPHSPN